LLGCHAAKYGLSGPEPNPFVFNSLERADWSA
jgi:hypothetical protein